MNTATETLKAAWNTLKNKLAAFIVLAALMAIYAAIPPVTFDPATGARSGGMPFAELLFTAILVTGTIAIAPIIRLLVFPEAARFAEDKMGLEPALNRGVFSPWLLHYWFATAICYLVTAAAIASIAH